MTDKERSFWAEKLALLRALQSGRDSGGFELVAIRAVELDKLKEQADKYKWQVRDTCVRAEKAESASPSTVRDDALEEAKEVACRHEPYQGRCVHCDLPFKNGQPVRSTPTALSPTIAPPDPARGLVEALRTACEEIKELRNYANNHGGMIDEVDFVEGLTALAQYETGGGR